MEVDDRRCNECGGTEFNKVLTKEYPEWRERDRDKTKQTVYDCVECGSQGKRFVDGYGGEVTFSGTLR